MKTIFILQDRETGTIDRVYLINNIQKELIMPYVDTIHDLYYAKSELDEISISLTEFFDDYFKKVFKAEIIEDYNEFIYEY